MGVGRSPGGFRAVCLGHGTRTRSGGGVPFVAGNEQHAGPKGVPGWVACLACGVGAAVGPRRAHGAAATRSLALPWGLDGGTTGLNTEVDVRALRRMPPERFLQSTINNGTGRKAGGLGHNRRGTPDPPFTPSQSIASSSASAASRTGKT